MTKLIISTVRRHIPVSEPSGFLYTLDFENQRILRRTNIIEPPYREWDNNPRGGLRGCRGIAINDEQIAIANASYIYRFNPNWTALGIISHPSCTAIHDILLSDNGVWVTSARNDLCAFLEYSGNMREFIYLREYGISLKGLGWLPPIVMDADNIPNSDIDFRDPRTNDDEKYNLAHVNSICFLANGDKLISMGLVLNSKAATLLKVKKWLYDAGYWQTILAFNRKVRETLKLRKSMHSELIVSPSQGISAVVRVADKGEVSLCLTLDRINTPSHSLLPIHDDVVIYLNTTKGEVIQFNHDSGHIISTTKVTDGFLRGVTLLPDGNVIMGSKGDLIVFDLNDQKIISSIRISSDPNESVYDIKILPAHFDLPPYTLSEPVKNLQPQPG
ncbi:MAG: hypothetical protein JW908_02290 [Anaerolineales bacterium]|nr:hypothetical protein [Anaerolineales bacterium]